MSLVLAELTATCNALGYAISEKNKYFLDKECKGKYQFPTFKWCYLKLYNDF